MVGGSKDGRKEEVWVGEWWSGDNNQIYNHFHLHLARGILLAASLSLSPFPRPVVNPFIGRLSLGVSWCGGQWQDEDRQGELVGDRRARKSDLQWHDKEEKKESRFRQMIWYRIQFNSDRPQHARLLLYSEDKEGAFDSAYWLAIYLGMGTRRPRNVNLLVSAPWQMSLFALGL